MRKDLVFVNSKYELDETFLPEQEHDILRRPARRQQVECAAYVSKPVHEFLGGIQKNEGLLLISLGAVRDRVNHDSGILGEAADFRFPFSAFFHQTISDFKVKCCPKYS